MKAVKIISRLFAVLLFGISVSNLSAQNKEITQSTAKTENPEIKKNVVAKTSQQNPLKSRNSERYRIGFQDTLEVVVFKHPELSQSVAVNPDGTIYLPRIESPIMAVCKTEGELKDNITALYKQTYLRDPFVNVKVSDQKSQGFSVLGAVQKPGTFYLNRRVQLLELLALAGGQDVEFAGGKIQVARVGSVAGCSQQVEAVNEKDNFQFLSFNLKDVLEGKQNPWMQPGDIISVLKSEEAYVVGDVFKPAKVPLNEPVTLTQAIAFAGGLNKTAKIEKVVIQRQATGNSPKTDLIINLKDIRDKKIPDPQLQANDIVDVGTDKVKAVTGGVLKALTGGVGNIFYRF